MEAVRLASEMRAEYWSVSAKTGELPQCVQSFLLCLYGMLESQPAVLASIA